MNTYLNFGSLRSMKKVINPADFGRRVRELREEARWSQGRLGKEAGFSQSNIGWIEQGKGKDPKKQALALADALGSTPEWLLYGTGDRQTGVRPLNSDELAALYNNLPLLVQIEITEAVKARISPPAKKKASR
jgi:transcriptional regulator with XRE-family HTH domain